MQKSKAHIQQTLFFNYEKKKMKKNRRKLQWVLAKKI